MKYKKAIQEDKNANVTSKDFKFYNEEHQKY